MAKLLSILSLILAIVLFPPAVLAVISNKAVPGDTTYPIKRGLENVIFVVASLNPVTKAWFAATRSDRRFKEFTILVTQGKKSGETLNELVEQTQVAASQIAQVNDQVQKQKLIQQLSESITRYDQGLQQASSPVAPLSQATPTPQPTQTSAPVVVQPTPRPTLTSQSTPAPTVPPTTPPTPNPIPNPSIEEARRRLEEIRGRLEEQQRNSQQQRTNQQSQPQGVRNTSGKEREDTNRRGNNTEQQGSEGGNGRSNENENEGNSGRRK